jgi:hypothetical protein
MSGGRARVVFAGLATAVLGVPQHEQALARGGRARGAVRLLGASLLPGVFRRPRGRQPGRGLPALWPRRRRRRCRCRSQQCVCRLCRCYARRLRTTLCVGLAPPWRTRPSSARVRRALCFRPSPSVMPADIAGGPTRSAPMAVLLPRTAAAGALPCGLAPAQFVAARSLTSRVLLCSGTRLPSWARAATGVEARGWKVGKGCGGAGRIRIE